MKCKDCNKECMTLYSTKQCKECYFKICREKCKDRCTDKHARICPQDEPH